MCMVNYVPENEAMQRGTVGEDGHMNHAEYDIEIMDNNQ